MSEAVAGLVGVVLGGIIAAGTSAFFAWLADRDRKLALAYSIALKAHRISDIVYKIRKSVNDSWANEAGEKWRVVTPVLGVPTEHVTFSTDELSLLLISKNDKVTNTLITTSNRYNLLLDIVHEYNARRKDLTHEVSVRANPQHSAIAGQICFDPGAFILIQPKLAEAESLVTLMHDQANECFPFSSELGQTIGATLKGMLNDDRFSVTMDFGEKIKAELAQEGAPEDAPATSSEQQAA